MRKISTVLVVTLMLFALSVTTVNGETTKKLGETKELYDAELMRIDLISGAKNIQVRLLGVKSMASEEAYKYVEGFVQAEPLYFKFFLDDHGQMIRDDNGFALAILSNTKSESLNNQLLAKGLADLDLTYSELEDFDELQKQYDYAKKKSLGIHGDGKPINFFSKKVNLNLASSFDISSILGIESGLSSKIRDYVRYNSLNTVEELKFVDSAFDADWIDKNSDKVSLMTHLNSAEINELSSVFTSSNGYKIAEAILDYRLQKPLKSIEELKKIDGVTDKIYDKVEPFVTLEYTETYEDSLDLHVVNVNTANVSQLKAIQGMPEKLAENIIKYRYNNEYEYKSKEALIEIPNGFKPDVFNRMEDNLVVATDINSAGQKELESLFGRFGVSVSKRKDYAKKIMDKRPFKKLSYVGYYIPKSVFTQIEPYVYIDKYEPETKLNVNMATTEQLMDELNLTKYQSEKITKYTKYHTLNYYKELHHLVDVSDYNDSITLYTNINTAGEEELMLMHKDMNDKLVKAIMDYRVSHVFGSREEVSKLFGKYKKLHIYNAIKDYIVFR